MATRSPTAPPARLVGAIGIAVTVGAGAELWLGLRFSLGPWQIYILDLATPVLFGWAGAVAWAVRPRSRSGPWMLALAVVMLLGRRNASPPAPTPSGNASNATCTTAPSSGCSALAWRWGTAGAAGRHGPRPRR